ncbi:carotenoid oxygenase family protein [Streptomyces sp. RPT161]|uniref:carotenoid oxygenase family protein n=1 Tax=Streptomyces sp. RPT161 TaxID=3015993 RepID=UPI002FD54295
MTTASGQAPLRKPRARREELTAYNLPVTGTVPPELAGWYLRNGPNPADAASGHWFFGDGMVHGIRIEDGQAVAYRNRWVRTTRCTDGAQPGQPCPHRRRGQHPRRPAPSPWSRTPCPTS